VATVYVSSVESSDSATAMTVRRTVIKFILLQIVLYYIM
jgi:hypothetical protein